MKKIVALVRPRSTMNFCKKLFSPLSKLAERAIYFACVNFFLFFVFF